MKSCLTTKVVCGLRYSNLINFDFAGFCKDMTDMRKSKKINKKHLRLSAQEKHYIVSCSIVLRLVWSK